MAVSNAVQKPDELVQLVDRHGNDVGVAPRERMRKENLSHRASAVLVFNSEGKIFVQKRVAFKETFPSYFDPAPGGVCGGSPPPILQLGPLDRIFVRFAFPRRSYKCLGSRYVHGNIHAC